MWKYAQLINSVKNIFFEAAIFSLQTDHKSLYFLHLAIEGPVKVV